MADDVISLIHRVELNLFKQFVKITHQHHINYIALGVTMLGAVRHQGFIPWDDDMDVGMLRSDYEYFLKVAKEDLKGSHFFLQTPWTDENYALSYSKLLDRNTFIEEKNNVNNARKGVFLDIFPLDRIPDSTARQRRQILDMRRLDSRIYLKLRYNVIDNPIRKFHTSLSAEQAETAEDFKKQRQEIMTMYNDKPALMTIKNLASQYAYEKEILTLDQLANTTDLPFEDTHIRVPADYDAILTRIYGDYMTLPPESARTEKHIVRLITDNQEFEL
ncbi:LPS cholinephosphotransferase LicD [Lentilactobacillus parakefiri]|uniref:LicD family protein n=1 Tax=Lentilactobacillus parakefiri TaxID=152332 RepID=UPI000BA55F6E|nr:LicD family protein [Lentilactobacillus parakefiri]PAL00046.1 LPS cholinephosphotransferase LicD [Lentilactobacillus parakefiri]